MHREKMLYTSLELIRVHICKKLSTERIKNASLLGVNLQQGSCKIHHHVIKKCVRTSKLDQLFEFTEIARDYYFSTKGQPQHH